MHARSTEPSKTIQRMVVRESRVHPMNIILIRMLYTKSQHLASRPVRSLCVQAHSVCTCNALRSVQLRQLRPRRIWKLFEAFPLPIHEFSSQPSAPRFRSLAAGQKPCKSSWQMPWKLSVGKDVQRNLVPKLLADVLSISIILFLT